GMPSSKSDSARRVVIIGAGAAGSMAAIFAARGGAETILLERTRDGGRKILISGGGRCNVLPMQVDESRFVTDSSPRSLRKILRSWPLAEQIAFFEDDLHIPLAEEPASLKLFPRSNKARDVRDSLLAAAKAAGAAVYNDRLVTGFSPRDAKWSVSCEGAPEVECDAVVVSTGGLSVPNTGSDGLGLRELARLGHTMNPAYAALTPVTATRSPFAELSGVSLRVAITARDDASGRSAASTGGFLFTHHGYSGPAVLDVSHVVVRSRLESNSSARLIVQWTELNAAAWEKELQPRGNRTVAGAIRPHLPDRLVAILLSLADCDPSRSLAELRREERLRIINVLVSCELPWDGDEGYKKAEVTGGGVSLGEVNPVSMESRRHRGLYICGEVLDAFGPVGGYNFLWAWATGRAAGIGATRGSV
ncbi:MAG TPA: aminoacetone oxidase family FAD-binding enzyme, partial [Gemmatimonadaceae bacterium]|nr:aminoacetone oxidase family FAD-binding enzyme [Gemmatimonadaceae bacterium]